MNQSKKKQTRDGSLTKGMPYSHIKDKKYEFLNLFGIDDKPVLFVCAWKTDELGDLQTISTKST